MIKKYTLIQCGNFVTGSGSKCPNTQHEQVTLLDNGWYKNYRMHQIYVHTVFCRLLDKVVWVFVINANTCIDIQNTPWQWYIQNQQKFTTKLCFGWNSFLGMKIFNVTHNYIVHAIFMFSFGISVILWHVLCTCIFNLWRQIKYKFMIHPSFPKTWTSFQ